MPLPPLTVPTTLGAALTAWMEAADLTREAAARRLGVPPNTLRNWREGRCSPSSRHLTALAAALGWSVERVVEAVQADRPIVAAAKGQPRPARDPAEPRVSRPPGRPKGAKDRGPRKTRGPATTT